MDNPGLKNLGDAALAAINAATTATVITSQPDRSGQTVAYLDRLEGMLAATLEAYFSYGSGGTSLKAIIENSGNQGTSWTEVARFAFTTVSAEKKFNLSFLTDKVAAYTPVALSDDTAVAGFSGDRWRARILTVGVYAGATSLALRMNAR